MNTRIRFSLIILFAILGALLHYKLGISSAWYLYVASLIILLTHFIFGTVWAAFAMLRKGKIAEAELLIGRIKRPDFLTKRHRAYYHFVKGMIALQNDSLEEGAEQLKMALDRRLRSANDNALAALNLAHIYFRQQKTELCRTALQKSKSFSPNDLMIKEKIAELEKVLATPFN